MTASQKVCVCSLLLALTVTATFWRYGISSAAGSPEAPILFINVNVIPMDREIVLYHHDVLVHDGTIIAVYPTNSKKIPADAQVIDGKGKWLLPGLADMHMHVSQRWMSADWPVNPLKLYLASGVTTLRCFGPEKDQNGATEYIFEWRRRISEGSLIGPVLYSCGPVLYGPVKNPQAEINRQVANGYDFIKLYSFLTPLEFDEALKTIKMRGIYVTGHIPMMVGLDNFLEAGVNEIAHIEELAWEYAAINRVRRDLRDREWIMYAGKRLYTYFSSDLEFSLEEIVEKYRDSLLTLAGKVKQAGVAVSTTLYIDEVIIDKLEDPGTFSEGIGNQFLPRSYLKTVSLGKDKHQVMFREAEDFAPFKRNLDRALLWALKDNDVTLVTGSDSGTGGMGIVPGFSLHEELKILVMAGYTPYEALAMATVTASQLVGLMIGQDDFGAITPGKRADLVLLGSNPLEDIDSARDIRGVMAGGRWYDEKTINEWLSQ